VRNLRNLCILGMVMFVIKNPDKYQHNIAIRGEDMRQRNQLHLQINKTIFSPKGCLLSGIRIFNSLPRSITNLKNEKTQFKVALKSF
jgi:hypothetical protein